MLSVIREGTAYSLDDGTYCFYTGDDGLGMAPLHRFTRRGPLQHGASDQGYRLDPRTILLRLTIPGESQPDLYLKRDQLIDLFSPGEQAISLRWVLPAGTRQIDVHYVDDLFYDTRSRSGWEQRIVARFQAPDPTFYNPVPILHTLAASGGGDTMLVPTVVPSTLGTSNFNEIAGVDYTGNWRGLPYRIRAHGPLTGLKITNETTGEVLALGATDVIADGDYYDFDLRYGFKTLVDSNGTSQLGKLTAASDLETWHLAPRDPLASLKTNSIRVEATSIDEGSQVNMSFFTRYLGV